MIGEMWPYLALLGHTSIIIFITVQYHACVVRVAISLHQKLSIDARKKNARCISLTTTMIGRLIIPFSFHYVATPFNPNSPR